MTIHAEIRQGCLASSGDRAGVPQSEPTELSAGLSIAVEETAARRSFDRRLRVAGLTIALIAHASLIYVVSRQPDDVFGAGGQVLEAINVEIVTASALESRAAEAGAAAAASEVADAAGSPVTATAARAAEQTRRRELSAEPVQSNALTEPEPAADVPAALAALPQPTEASPKPETTTPDAKSDAKPQEQDSATAAASASQQGAAAARGDDVVSAQAAAAAAASPGAAREYGKAVLRALSRSKPKAPGALGTVWIEFVLAQSGALAEARVKTPSGKPVLDEAALDAVRRARFPVPPAGLSASQLTFAIPYYFR